MAGGPDILEALDAKFGVSGMQGANAVMDCPFCGAAGHFAVYVADGPKLGVFQCWVCHEHGGRRRLEEEVLEGVPVAASVRVKARPKTPVAGVMPCDDPDDCIDLCRVSLEDEAGLYVLNRFGATGDGYRMKDEMSAFWNVQYCKRGRKFAGGLYNTGGTLIFPVDNVKGDIVGWQSRLLYDPDKVEDWMVPAMGWKWDAEKGRFQKPPKYFTAPGWEKGSTLYNISDARKGDLIILTEGVFDVFAAGRSAVCALGKGALTDRQRGLLKAFSKCIVLLLDPDAEKEQAQLARSLADDRHVILPVRLEGYKDAGEAGRREVHRQIRQTAARQGVELGRYRWFQQMPGEGCDSRGNVTIADPS